MACGAARGVNSGALLSPARQLAMLGRTVGRVWGSARALGPTWQYARPTRVVGHDG